MPQAWARALEASGFDGILAGLRFSPGRPVGLALFGDAGVGADWATDPDPTPAAAVATRLEIRLVLPPTLDQLTIRQPLDG